jgi:hypothetical protein
MEGSGKEEEGSKEEREREGEGGGATSGQDAIHNDERHISQVMTGAVSPRMSHHLISNEKKAYPRNQTTIFEREAPK